MYVIRRLMLGITVVALLHSAAAQRVAYVDNGDSTSIAAYNILLSNAGYAVDNWTVTDCETANLSGDIAIIVGKGTASGTNWGTTAAVARVASAGKPIIGNGTGGGVLFDRMGLQIGDSACWSATGGDVMVIDDLNPAWTSAYPTKAYLGEQYHIYTNQGYGNRAVYRSNEVPGIVCIGREVEFGDHFPLIAQQGPSGPCLHWGFSGYANQLSPGGTNFLRNCLQGKFLSRYHPCVATLSNTGASVVLSISNLSVNATTQVQRAGALLPTAWSTQVTFTAQGGESNVTLDASGSAAGFYRIFCPGAP